MACVVKILLILGSTLNVVSCTEKRFGSILLTKADFPEHFVNMSHPEDYQILTAPLPVEYIYHSKASNSRLIVRISYRVGTDQYLPMSFIVDTGNPTGFVLSAEAMKLLQYYYRIKTEELGNEYVEVSMSSESMHSSDPNRMSLRNSRCNSFKAMSTEGNYASVTKNANVIGLQVICKLGLEVREDHDGFSFIRKILWF